MAELKATNVDGTVVALRQENATSTSKTLALTDRDKVVACTNASAITITVPNNSSVAFPIGSLVYVARVGTGSVALAAAGGVTLTKTGSLGEGEELYIRKRATNNWVVVERPYNLEGTGGSQSASGNFQISSFTSGTGTFTVQ